MDQRGIDVRNTNASSDMFNITISGNILDTDGSKWFGAGIRLHDAWRGRIIGNTVVYKYSAGTTSSWGIEAAEVTLSAMTYVLIADNYVDCLSSATSRAIQVTGVANPTIRGNTVLDWGAFGIRLESDCTDPIIADNTLDGASAATAISDQATGSSHWQSNRLANTDAVNVGFFGTTPIVKPTVTGARDETEGALAVLLTKLAALGLITDSSTAS